MKPRQRVVGIFLLLGFFSFFTPVVSGQSVECEYCDGVCPGATLDEYINIINGTISNISGDVIDLTGNMSTNLDDYSFDNVPPQEVTLSFTDGTDTTLIFSPFLANIDVNFSCPDQLELSSNGNPNGTFYQWSIINSIPGFDSQQFAQSGLNLSSITEVLPIPLSGEYAVSLTASYGPCQQASTLNLTLNDLLGEPELEFQNNGQTLISENNIVTICGEEGDVLNVEAFDISSPSFSNQATVTYSIDGGPFNPFNNSEAILNNFIIPDADSDGDGIPDWFGENILVCLRYEDQGCLIETCYNILITGDPFADNSFSAQYTGGAFICAPDSVSITCTPGPTNSPGSAYLLSVLCGDDTVYQEFWPINEVPEGDQWNTSFYSELSSCGCGPYSDSNFNDWFRIVATPVHPCVSNPPGQNYTRVNINIDAGITQFVDTICVEENQTLCYSNIDAIGQSNHCEATFEWSVNCPDGTDCTPMENDESCLDVDFNVPGIYTVNLLVTPVNQACNPDSSSVTICVNPNISDIGIGVEWNIPDPLCTDAIFFPEVFYEDNLITCNHPEIEWELTGPENNTWSDTSIIEIESLSYGNYILSASAALPNCDEIWLNDTTFTVMGGPRIDSNIVDIPCVGQQVVVFDNWFCIADSLSDISTLEVQLFESEDGDLSGLSPDPQWIGDPSDYDPCASDFGDDFVWSEAEAGEFVLLIIAENACHTDSLCIPFEIEEQEPLTFDNIELEYCVGDSVDLTILAGSNSPPGVNVGVFSFTCPNPNNCPGDMVYGSNPTWNTAGYPPGDYSISFSMACYESVDTVITLHENPIIDLSPSPITICNEDTVLSPEVVNSLILDPNSCNWTYPGGPSNSCDLNLTAPITPGTYIFSGETEFGCPGSATLEIDIETFQVDGSNLAISCNQAGLDLNQLIYTLPVSPGDIMWQICDATGNNCNTEIPDGAGIIDLSAYTAGSYQLLWNYTSLIDCDYSGSLDFEIGDLETPNFSTEFEELCLGETITINELGNLNGSWNIVECPGGFPCSETFSSDNTQFTWNTDNGNGEPGPYLIEYSGVCIDPDTVTIIINDIPSFNVIGAPLVCQDSLVELTTDYIGSGTFVWTSNVILLLS